MHCTSSCQLDEGAVSPDSARTLLQTLDACKLLRAYVIRFKAGTQQHAQPHLALQSSQCPTTTCEGIGGQVCTAPAAALAGVGRTARRQCAGAALPGRPGPPPQARAAAPAAAPCLQSSGDRRHPRRRWRRAASTRLWCGAVRLWSRSLSLHRTGVRASSPRVTHPGVMPPPRLTTLERESITPHVFPRLEYAQVQPPARALRGKYPCPATQGGCKCCQDSPWRIPGESGGGDMRIQGPGRGSGPGNRLC